MGRVSLTVALGAPAEAVWERATSLEGVNHELGPVLRMTVPRGVEGKTIGDLEPGVAVGRSWILLGGLIPVDYDDLKLAAIEPPRRFLEDSRMASMESWGHERTIEPTGPGECALTDTLTFEPRAWLRWIPGIERLSAWFVRALFGHRHRRLVAVHGVPASVA